jgi:hypothetical protein
VGKFNVGLSAGGLRGFLRVRKSAGWGSGISALMAKTLCEWTRSVVSPANSGVCSPSGIVCTKSSSLVQNTILLNTQGIVEGW